MLLASTIIMNYTKAGIMQDRIDIMFADPPDIPADGISRTVIFTRVIYENRTGADNITVYFTLLDGDMGGEFLSDIAVTNATGWAITELIASVNPGPQTINATAEGFGWKTVEVFFFDTLVFELWASPPSIPADGNSITTIITTLANFWGPIDDVTVDLKTNNGVFLPDERETISVTTNQDGVAFAELKSNEVAGQAIVNATFGPHIRETIVTFFPLPEYIKLKPFPDPTETEIPANPDFVLMLEAQVNDTEKKPIPGVFVDIWSERGWIEEINFMTDDFGIARAVLHSSFEVGMCIVHAETFNGKHDALNIVFFGMAREIAIKFSQPNPADPSQGIVNYDSSRGPTGIEIKALLFDDAGHRVFQPGQMVRLNTTQPVLFNGTHLVKKVNGFSDEEGVVHFFANFSQMSEPGSLLISASLYVNKTTFWKHFYIIYKQSDTIPSVIRFSTNEPVHRLGGLTEIFAEVLDDTYILSTHRDDSVVKFNSNFNSTLTTNYPGRVGDPAIYSTFYSPNVELIPPDPWFFEVVNATYTDSFAGVFGEFIFEIVDFERAHPFEDLARVEGEPAAGGSIADADIEGVTVSNHGELTTVIGEIETVIPEMPFYWNRTENFNFWARPIPPPGLYVNITHKLYVHCIEGEIEVIYDKPYNIPGNIAINFFGHWKILTLDGRYARGPGPVHINGVGTISNDTIDGKLVVHIGNGTVNIINEAVHDIDPDNFRDEEVQEAIILGQTDNFMHHNESHQLLQWGNFSGNIVNYHVYVGSDITQIDWENPNATIDPDLHYLLTEYPEIQPPETGIDDKYTGQFFVISAIDAEGNNYTTIEESFLNGSDQQGRRSPSSGGGAVPVTITGSLGRTLKAGQWNVISIPFETEHNASSLAEEIGFTVKYVVQRDPNIQTFETFRVGFDSPADAFPINYTEAYYIWVTADTNITWSGSIDYNFYPSANEYQLLDDIYVNLKPTDWTLISYPSFIQASITIAFNSTRLPAGTIVQIAIMDNSEIFNYHINDDNFPMVENFEVVGGEGYFVWTSETTDILWNPR